MSRNTLEPLVSVVIPFAGKVDWLVEAVDSVLAQTFTSWEVVIVSDEPLSAIAHVVNRDDRIRAYAGDGTGPAASRNAGIQASQGEYVAFLDADDLFRRNKLECQLAAMRDEGADFSHTSYEQFGNDGERIATIPSGHFSGHVYPAILLRCPVATPTVMVRRELLLDTPFNETLSIGEDTLEWIALARVANLLGVDEPLSCVRIHGNNAALDAASQVAAWQSIYHLALPADRALPGRVRRRTKSEIRKTIALLERQRGRRIAATRERIHAFILQLPASCMRIVVLTTQFVLSPRSTLARARNRRRLKQREIQWISRADAVSGETLRAQLLPARTVVDVGPGIKPQALLSPDVHICVEPFEPYVRRLRDDVGDDTRFIFFNATWDRVLPLLPDRSVDSVVALDVIEHMRRRDGARLLADAQRIARKQVVVFTPLGFYRQSYRRGERDRWGMEGGHWQTHRSGWVPDDFPADWEIVACSDFHNLDEYDQPLEQPFGAFWAIYTRIDGEPREGAETQSQ
jgi:hypothetical protein